jgi:hypothetical protein
VRNIEKDSTNKKRTIIIKQMHPPLRFEGIQQEEIGIYGNEKGKINKGSLLKFKLTLQ